jgi:hypothetical protein
MSTLKQLVMFRQLTVLIPMLPMTLFDKVGPVILRIIAPCITSEHFQVALNSAMFCSSPEFLDLFRVIPDEVANILIVPAIFRPNFSTGLFDPIFRRTFRSKFSSEFFDRMF